MWLMNDTNKTPQTAALCDSFHMNMMRRDDTGSKLLISLSGYKLMMSKVEHDKFQPFWTYIFNLPLVKWYTYCTPHGMQFTTSIHVQLYVICNVWYTVQICIHHKDISDVTMFNFCCWIELKVPVSIFFVGNFVSFTDSILNSVVICIILTRERKPSLSNYQSYWASTIYHDSYQVLFFQIFYREMISQLRSHLTIAHSKTRLHFNILVHYLLYILY